MNLMRMYFPELINHMVINAAEEVARRGGMSLNDLHEPEITDALVTEFPTMVNNVIYYKKKSIKRLTYKVPFNILR